MTCSIRQCCFGIIAGVNGALGASDISVTNVLCAVCRVFLRTFLVYCTSVDRAETTRGRRRRRNGE